MGRGGVRVGAGRPKKNNDEKRTETLSIRATKKEMERIKECSEILGITRADTIAKAIEDLHKKIVK